MRTLRIAAVIGAAALFGIAAVALARGPGGGWGCGSAYNRMYNPKTEVSFKGKISRIDRVETIKGASPGIHIMVTGDDPCTDCAIHLGPAWYIDNQDTKIDVGDEVEIVGSKVDLNGTKAVIARELRKGDDILVLRDKDGIPYWSGWRRRAK